MSRTLAFVMVWAVVFAGCSRKPAPAADAAAVGDAPAVPSPDAVAAAPDTAPPPAADAAATSPGEPPASAGQRTRGGTGAPSGFEQFYSYTAPVYAAAGAPPSLPIAPETLRASAAYASGALGRMGLDDAATAKLSQQAFVVVAANPGFRYDDPAAAFRALEASDVPLYVSVDTALHLYHLIFDGLLMKIETEHLVPLLGRLLDALRAKAVEQSGAEGILGTAALRNLALLDAARRLLDPAAAVDERVRADVEAEVALIDGRSGFARSPVFGYDEDYTQYVVRGHYTRSATLGRYFRTMMWLGRMALLVRADDDGEPRGLVSRADAQRFAAQSLLFVQWLREAQVDGTAALHAWSRIYRVTAFFAGFADDLTPTEVAAAAERALDEVWTAQAVTVGDRLEALRLQIMAARVPKLFGGAALEEGEAPGALPPPAEPLTSIEQAILPTVGLRLFGQRYVPDAEVMARLAFPFVKRYTGEGTPFTLVPTPAGPMRGFSRGLDVFALLGAPTARGHLAALGDDAYEGYVEAFADAGTIFPPAGHIAWRANLYWAWLDVLRETVAPAAPATQAFQTVPAWSDRLLSGALASWATLRHDTILYVKQPYAPKAGAAAPAAVPPPGFVDPYPEVFARLRALTQMTHRALRDLHVIEDGSEAAAVLDEFDGFFDRLTATAVAEVENRALTEEQQQFLRAFPGWCSATLGRLAALLGDAAASPEVDLGTQLVADVMTNMDASEVLEEAGGGLELLVAAVRIPGSAELFVAAGPVLSYFEFRTPIGQRLTDEAWRAMLAGSAAPSPPSWTCSFRSPCAVP
jgi:hypothetical protein